MDLANFLFKGYSSMTMIDIHKEALENTLVQYHEFIKSYKENSKVVYGFVEGVEDPCFYRGFIDNKLPEEWKVQLWAAGNQKKVLQIYSKFDWRRFKKIRIAFFIDRDLFNFIPHELPSDTNIYTTDKYSIENDIVCKNTCERVLTELCGFSNLPHNELETILELFEEQLDCFQQMMIPIMACIIKWRKDGNKACLDNIEMKDIFSFSSGKIQIKKLSESQTEYIHKKCNIPLASNNDLSQIEKEFKSNNHNKKFVRGKYLLWFFVSFCISIKNDWEKLNLTLKKPRRNVPFSFSNAIQHIGPRAKIPASLNIFLENTYVKYALTKK